uniref:PiggyBac transposable element-derived protein domain-containing protein n=1 Tax=Knipowitschia caucasica TaxID=637954 RepID=A0AAV2LC55_KNICA
MTSTLPAGKNHKVFADNYFTSVPLVEHLKERGIYYIGTVRMNRTRSADIEIWGEKHALAKISSCCWKLSHKCRKGQDQEWQTTNIFQSWRDTCPTQKAMRSCAL